MVHLIPPVTLIHWIGHWIPLVRDLPLRWFH